MKIKQLRIQSFRGISDLTLDFDDRLNVLIGNNGSGKSSILDSLGALLNSISDLVYTLYVDSNNIIDLKKQRVKNIFLDDDISVKNEKIVVQSEANINLLDFKLIIQKNKKRKESIIQIVNSSSHSELQKFVNSDNIPVLIYYSVKRNLVFEECQASQEAKSNTPFDAYIRAFTGGKVVFQEFFEWFKLLEELENELIRDNPNYRDKQLESVRQAIYTFLPEFKDLRIRRRPELRMTVTKNDAELTINQLSDGEKNLLAMVGDLARRLAIANPDMEKPEHGSGAVLIDEIELHLYPKWQRMVIPALLRTFPNCQFIITTHSPQVLGEVKDGKIYRLANTQSGVTAEIVRTYGRDSNRILEDEMGVPKRNQKIKDDLLNLFRLIDDGNLTQAKELQTSLKEEIGFDEPEFARADVLIHRKEVLGR
ncbi:AAA family ATPase [Pseudanabaena mucicola]|jgi:predicted ATP-binding protein involved in virulence|uniref:AAA family ATPase n=1 Tax=Pseudanabaena mucicola TaxID=71190 RepID=UPI002577812A|nr:AAA family ATPase [Pseudanabaena mucicola]